MIKPENKFKGNSYESIIEHFDSLLRINESFDLINRKLTIANKKASIYFIDGFTKDEILQKLQSYFCSLDKSTLPKDADRFCDMTLPYIEIDKSSDTDVIIKNILSGVACLIIEDYTEAILIDSRTYPARTVQEPDKDKVLRGSRDGFVETIVFNTALIRRRIRSTDLTIKMLNIGEISKTDIAVCYMEKKVDKKVINTLLNKIKNIQIESLTMNQESLAECLIKKQFWNPFPKFKYSERPDTSVASILEGSIIILVDNSPSAMILPTSIFDICEEADDYYFPPIVGTYLRFSRLIISLIALYLTPLYLFFTMNEALLPERFEFLKLAEDSNIPILLQLLILEIAIDGMKLAAVNTPNMLNTPLSIIAAIVIGDAAVQSGWFNAETLLYMAFVAFANFTHNSLELGYALKFTRLIMLILVQLTGAWGFLIGTILLFLALLCNHTVTGKCYMYPLIPLDIKQLYKRFIRISTLTNHDMALNNKANKKRTGN